MKIKRRNTDPKIVLTSPTPRTSIYSTRRGRKQSFILLFLRPPVSSALANGDSIFRYIYADTQKELTAKLRQNIDIYQGIDFCGISASSGVKKMVPYSESSIFVRKMY